MSEKWTPGPWVVQEPIGAEHAEVRSSDGCRIAVAIGGYPIRTKTEDANACLMASAPDLYNVLKSVEWLTDPGFPEYSCCPVCSGVKETGHKKDCKLNAALKKARGE